MPLREPHPSGELSPELRCGAWSPRKSFPGKHKDTLRRLGRPRARGLRVASHPTSKLELPPASQERATAQGTGATPSSPVTTPGDKSGSSSCRPQAREPSPGPAPCPDAHVGWPPLPPPSRLIDATIGRGLHWSKRWVLRRGEGDPRRNWVRSAALVCRSEGLGIEPGGNSPEVESGLRLHACFWLTFNLREGNMQRARCKSGA